MASTDRDDNLRVQIGESVLVDPGQYNEVVSADDQDRVDLVRRTGRAVGRQAGVPIRTFMCERPDGLLEVWVVNVKPTDPADDLAQARMRRRKRAAVNAASETLRKT